MIIQVDCGPAPCCLLWFSEERAADIHRNDSETISARSFAGVLQLLHLDKAK